MIVDSILNIERYVAILPSIGDIIFNIQNDLLQPGKQVIDDESFFIHSIYNTERPDEIIYENHKKYLDVHLVLKGEESILFGDAKYMNPVRKYDEVEDYELLNYPGNIGTIVIHAMNFAILFPGEAHKGGVSIDGTPCKVEKVVIKMRMKE